MAGLSFIAVQYIEVGGNIVRMIFSYYESVNYCLETLD